MHPPDRDEVWKFFEENGAIQEGDFKLASGRRATKKFVVERLFVKPRVEREFRKQMVDALISLNLWPQVVMGPANGGNILAPLLRFTLQLRRPHPDVLCVPTVRKGPDEFFIEEMYGSYVKERDVWVVDDAYTTGGSLSKVIRACEAWGGKVVAATVGMNRSGTPMQLFDQHGDKIPTRALLDLDDPSLVEERGLQI